MSFALAHAANGTRHGVTVVTSLETNDPVAAAVKLARETLDEAPTRQSAAHEAIWREFWSASGVALADAYLESVWYRNLYFLRCCSKPGVPPIGLFMGCATDVMPWHGCATTDYNFEQCFWDSFVTNHSAMAASYISYIVDYRPRGKWFSKETYGLEGAFYPVNHFTHQINDPMVCKTKKRHMNYFLPWTSLKLSGDTRGNYSEPMAAAGIVSELLLQSVGNVIRVFPAWPQDQDAGFITLRAQGGFLVTAEQIAGKVTKLEITSTVGGKLRVLNPWAGRIIEQQTQPGQKLHFTK